MQTAVLFRKYWAWHYSQAIDDMYGVWKNFLWFFYVFFSIDLLRKTFFQPWRRLSEPYQKGLDPGALLQTFIVNTLMRIVGIGVRVAVLVLYFALNIVTVVFGVVLFVLWFMFPLAIMGAFITGLYFLFV